MRVRNFVAVVLSLGISAAASAATVDLTQAGSSGTVNNAFFSTTDVQPTGTGVMDPFLRIQGKNTEQGYNTSVRPVEFDEKTDGNFTRPLAFNTLLPVTINGTDYYQFLLDVNEQGNSKSFISMDEIKVFQSDTGAVTGYAQNQSNLGTLIYDLDSNADNEVMLNGRLEQGSGKGGVLINIPKSLFINKPFVVFYAALGADASCGGGFEEFAALTGTTSPAPTPVPLPAAFYTGLSTLALLVIPMRKKFMSK